MEVYRITTRAGRRSRSICHLQMLNSVNQNPQCMSTVFQFQIRNVISFEFGIYSHRFVPLLFFLLFRSFSSGHIKDQCLHLTDQWLRWSTFLCHLVWWVLKTLEGGSSLIRYHVQTIYTSFQVQVWKCLPRGSRKKIGRPSTDSLEGEGVTNLQNRLFGLDSPGSLHTQAFMRTCWLTACKITAPK